MTTLIILTEEEYSITVLLLEREGSSIRYLIELMTQFLCASEILILSCYFPDIENYMLMAIFAQIENFDGSRKFYNCTSTLERIREGSTFQSKIYI